MVRALAATAVLIALTWGAWAQEPGPVLDGIYTFATTAEKDGKPICTEKWTFNAGTMTIISGAELSHSSFRTETDMNGLSWLVRTTLDTNGKPDCTGTSAIDVPGPKPESRTYFFVRNSGSIALCEPPTKTPDGSDFTAKCWGEATPVY